MRRALLPALLLLPLACTQLDEPATASPSDTASTPSSQASATTTGAATNAGLSAEVRDAALAAPKLDRMKLRFDESGALVKQSAYHDDANAIPAAVRELAEATYPGHSATGYESEHYAELGLVYEVELDTAEGQHCEVAGREDGSLIYTECRVANDAIPTPVAEAIRNTMGEAKILEVELKTQGDAQEYSVELELDGSEFYLHLASDGALISKHRLVPAVVELPIP